MGWLVKSPFVALTNIKSLFVSFFLVKIQSEGYYHWKVNTNNTLHFVTYTRGSWEGLTRVIFCVTLTNIKRLAFPFFQVKTQSKDYYYWRVKTNNTLHYLKYNLQLWDDGHRLMCTCFYLIHVKTQSKELSGRASTQREACCHIRAIVLCQQQPLLWFFLCPRRKIISTI